MRFTHSAYDVLMVSKVSFAGLATIYLVAIEICVVSQPHCLMSCPLGELARWVWSLDGPGTRRTVYRCGPSCDE